MLVGLLDTSAALAMLAAMNWLIVHARGSAIPVVFVKL